MDDFEQIPSEALSKVTAIVEKLDTIKIEMNQSDPESKQRSWREYITSGEGSLGGVKFFKFLKQGLEDKEPITEVIYDRVKAIFPKELVQSQLEQIQRMLYSKDPIETQTIISFISEELPDTLYNILEDIEEVRDSYAQPDLIEWASWMRDYLGNLSNCLGLQKFIFSDSDIESFIFPETETFIYNEASIAENSKEIYIRDLKFYLMHARDFYTIHNFDLD